MKQRLTSKIALLLIMSLVLVQVSVALSVSVLSTDPAPLQAGDFADITIQVTSSINEQKYDEVRIDFKETNFIRVVSSYEKLWTNFESGRSATHTFRIFIEDDLPTGSIDFEFDIATEQGKFSVEDQVFVQDADSNPELFIGKVQSTPKELLPDTDDNEITITVQNLGDKDAELVRAKVVSDKEIIKPAYSFSLEDTLSSIPAGSQEELVFTIDIEETTLTEIPSRLELLYRSDSANGVDYETINTVIPFNLEIIEAPLLRVVEVNQVDSFVGGSTENEVLIGIKNEGLTEAEEVRVRLVPDVSYPFLFELTTRYVSSNIQPGETAYVSFKTEVQDSADARDYTITAKLESLIGETRYVREDVVSITTTPGKELPIQSISLVIIAVIIIVGAIIGFKTYNGRKRPKRMKRRN